MSTESNENSPVTTEKVKGSRAPFRYRIEVTVPMSALGIIDDLFVISTLGTWSPGLSLKYGFRASMRYSRRLRDAEQTGDNE